jgi:hypothetical protein
MPVVDVVLGLLVLVVAGVGLWFLYSTLRSGNRRGEE